MNIKNVVIGIAIIILTIFVAVYGINTFYPKPEYNDFCGEMKTREIITTQEKCEEIGGNGMYILLQNQFKMKQKDIVTGILHVEKIMM